MGSRFDAGRVGVDSLKKKERQPPLPLGFLGCVSRDKRQQRDPLIFFRSASCKADGEIGDRRICGKQEGEKERVFWTSRGWISASRYSGSSQFPTMPTTAKRWLPKYWVPDLEPITRLVPLGICAVRPLWANDDARLVSVGPWPLTMGKEMDELCRSPDKVRSYLQPNEVLWTQRAPLELSVTRWTAQGMLEAITERGTW